MDALLLRARQRSWPAVALLLGPAVALLTLGFVLPVLQTAHDSVRNTDGSIGVDLANIGWALTTAEPRQALANSLAWAVVVPAASTVVGLATALLVASVRRRSIPQFLLVWPMSISYVGAASAWALVYQDRTSPLSTPLLMLIMIWVQSGFAMILLVAPIAGIPSDVVEAAAIDGAVGWRRLTAITVPMIAGRLLMVGLAIAVLSWKVFDIVRATTYGNYGTQVVANAMFTETFAKADAGHGSALAVILLIGVIPLVALPAISVRRQVLARSHRAGVGGAAR